MSAFGSGFGDVMRLIARGGPAVCNVSVTNVCNATCDFCNYAHDKGFVTDRRWMDADRLEAALAILRERADVRYVTFMGGEPLLHPRIAEMAATALRLGMQPTLVTNGWQLPDKLDRLAEAGIKTVFTSIDAADAAVHERNRGLKGVCARIAEANRRMPALGMLPIASVTMSKLVDDYEALGRFLVELGFAAVTFSYPRQAALGSSSLAWSAESDLVDLTPERLLVAFEQVNALRQTLPVHNPRASVADMQRRLRGEAERFACFGGYKYFYMDWTYDLWRCEAWDRPICPVWEFDASRTVRDGCQACTTDCYRDASVMLHFAVSLGDAAEGVRHGRPGAILSALADRRNFAALGAILENGSRLTRLAARRKVAVSA
ncbi:MAG TPA: radical SAM protein [Acetobacteraceae bacterium]|nr:radical SAM protein [Acetobacteraceae bacterium]